MSTTQSQIKLNDGEYIKIPHSIYKKENMRFIIIRKYLPLADPDEIKEFSFGIPSNYRITMYRFGKDIYYLIEFIAEIWLVHDNKRNIEQIINDIDVAIGGVVSNLFRYRNYDDVEEDEDTVDYIGIGSDDIKEGDYEISVTFRGKQYNIIATVVLSEYLEESGVYGIRVTVDCSNHMILLRDTIESEYKHKEEIKNFI